jgi:peptidyl-prolyl cis-trans isomerase A (cyclophilin A)
MPCRGKNTAIKWMSVLLVALAGCGRSGDGKQSTVTAIAGQDGASPTTAGDRNQLSPKPPSDPLHPEVVIETSLGNIRVRLDRQKALLTVDNFLNYVEARHYDRTIVHQVYKGQCFLAGGYGINLVERPGRTPVRNEADNGLKNGRGTISMARLPDAVDSATCQFFINVADNPSLDFKDRTLEGYGYCVFGNVIEGLDVIDKIGNVEVTDTKQFERTPVQPIEVKSIRRTR